MKFLDGTDGTQSSTRAAKIASEQHVATTSGKPMRQRLLDALNKEFGLGVQALDDLKLHYIRGVSEFELKQKPVRTVIFPPEFLYTADIGLDRLAGFNLFYRLPDVDPRVLVLGDPDFPDIGQVDFWSVRSRKPGDLAYPDVPGSILVAFRSPTRLAEAQAALAGYLADVSVLSAERSTFIGTGSPFEEESLIARIEANVPDVKYAETNGRIRHVNFKPGWIVDEVL